MKIELYSQQTASGPSFILQSKKCDGNLLLQSAVPQGLFIEKKLVKFTLSKVLKFLLGF